MSVRINLQELDVLRGLTPTSSLRLARGTGRMPGLRVTMIILAEKPE